MKTRLQHSRFPLCVSLINVWVWLWLGRIHEFSVMCCVKRVQNLFYCLSITIHLSFRQQSIAHLNSHKCKLNTHKKNSDNDKRSCFFPLTRSHAKRFMCSCWYCHLTFPHKNSTFLWFKYCKGLKKMRFRQSSIFKVIFK